MTLEVGHEEIVECNNMKYFPVRPLSLTWHIKTSQYAGEIKTYLKRKISF